MGYGMCLKNIIIKDKDLGYCNIIDSIISSSKLIYCKIVKYQNH